MERLHDVPSYSQAMNKSMQSKTKNTTQTSFNMGSLTGEMVCFKEREHEIIKTIHPKMKIH